MKNILIVLLPLLYSTLVQGQNVGIGTNAPDTRLQVNGDFSVVAAYSSSNSAPTPGQTITLVNASTINISSLDSVARIYDPGGAAGNYIANLSANASIGSASNSYLEFTIESADMKTGDSLIIYSGGFTSSPVYLAVGNNYVVSNISYTMSSANALLVFKSNADVSVGAGFSILFKRRYYANTLPSNNNIAGNSLLFYASKGALRSGKIVTGASIGENSAAFGNNTIASGFYSTAFGTNSQATSANTVAMGSNCISRGSNTVAMGSFSEAIGAGSIAGGVSSISTGEYSLAIGSNCESIGDASVAIGNNATARGNYSFATGSASLAYGSITFASGFSTEANGYNSSTFGYNSRAMGSSSIAMGLSTIARSYASLAIGRYNDTVNTETPGSWQSGDRAFVIGDGTSDAARSTCFYILKNGNGWMQGTLTENSDARLKTNINKVDNALNKIKQLNGYNYNWKDSAMLPGLYTGVLAQEVQQVMPELVVPNTEGQLAVNYNGLIPYLIESIKALEKQNTELRERISVVEKKKRKK